jgi:hypothetical protein
MSPKEKLLLWKEAQKRHRLSDRQVQMARELGFDPRKLGKPDNHKQEPWKAPLPRHIENLYLKRFGREEPLCVKSIAELLKEDEIKRVKRKKTKEAKRESKRDADERNGAAGTPLPGANDI